MYPLESGGCTILGLSSPCPSHVCFSNHVFFLQLQLRPPSEAPHPPALNPGAGKGEGLQTVVAHGHHKSLVPGWVFTPTPCLFLFIIDVGMFSNLLVLRSRLWEPPERSIPAPQNQGSTLRWHLANSPNSRFPPVPTTKQPCRTSRFLHFTLP